MDHSHERREWRTVRAINWAVAVVLALAALVVIVFEGEPRALVVLVPAIGFPGALMANTAAAERRRLGIIPYVATLLLVCALPLGIFGFFAAWLWGDPFGVFFLVLGAVLGAFGAGCSWASVLSLPDLVPPFGAVRVVALVGTALATTLLVAEITESGLPPLPLWITAAVTGVASFATLLGALVE